MKTTEQQHNERKRELMEKCFECYAENGLTSLSQIKVGCTDASPCNCRETECASFELK